MKKAVKLSAIVMCVVMILASCTAPIVPKNPALDGVGGTVNGDGTITLPGGVVATPDGFVAGEIVDGCVKNPDGSVSKPEVLTDDEYLMVYKVAKFFGSANGDLELRNKFKENNDEKNNRFSMTLTEPHTVDKKACNINGKALTLHSLTYVIQHSGTEVDPKVTINGVIIFSVEGDSTKHTFQQSTKDSEATVNVYDGKVMDVSKAPADPDNH